jgi:hypothetical protein
MRGALLDLRLAVFAHGGHRERLFALAAEIAATTDGDRDTVSFRPVETDIQAFDPIAAAPASVGTTLLWRIVRLGTNDYPLGYQVKVEPDQRDERRKLLAAGPTADDLLAWYHKAN